MTNCISGKHFWSNLEDAQRCCNPNAKVAALFVTNPGPYYGLVDVDPWDIIRDARAYNGPYPIVAHPPCARWSRLAFMTQATLGKNVGDDGGCFASAIRAIRKWGGVIEHPKGSMAYDAFGLQRPYRGAGWLRDTSFDGAYVCEVDQGVYGNPLVKPTWLYFFGFGVVPPSMNWNQAFHGPRIQLEQHKKQYTKFELMQQRERSRTPYAFRDALLNLAKISRSHND